MKLDNIFYFGIKSIRKLIKFNVFIHNKRSDQNNKVHKIDKLFKTVWLLFHQSIRQELPKLMASQKFCQISKFFYGEIISYLSYVLELEALDLNW